MSSAPLHVILRESAKAGKGKLRAQLLIGMGLPAKHAPTRKLANLAATIKYKRICQAAFEEADRKGRPRPDPTPHPDDLVFHARTGELCCNGPADEWNKALWDDMIALRAEIAEDIEEDTKLCEEHREISRKERVKGLRIVGRLDCFFPNPETRRKPGFNFGDWRRDQAILQRAGRQRMAASRAGTAAAKDRCPLCSALSEVGSRGSGRTPRGVGSTGSF